MPRKAASPKPVEIDKPRAPLVLAVVAFTGVSLTVGAIMWGRSDAGAINVSATIANSQYAADTEAAGGAPVTNAAQEYIDMPNGGLVAQPEGSTPLPPPPEPAETASTTEMSEVAGESDTESAGTEETTGEATSDTEAEPEESSTEPEDSSVEGEASI